jgi:formylglycine-generating enzyme required for sulfatase activity
MHGLSEERLVEVVEGIEESTEYRRAAGALLAISGDPRIQTFSPTMTPLTGGSVTIGTDPDQVERIASEWAHRGVEVDWIWKEVPRHHVRIRSFSIGRYLVTNQEYYDFVSSAAAARLPSSWALGTFQLGCANHPVHSLEPSDAEAYCLWLSRRTGRHFRLPTEEEWEFAATGGSLREFPWGDQWKPDHANTAEEGVLASTPIGMYPLGNAPTGVAEMAGNVEEIVSTSYASYPGGQLIKDDLYLEIGSAYRIARGGSFARYGDLARCARRHGVYRGSHYVYGFRLAEDTC